MQNIKKITDEDLKESFTNLTAILSNYLDLTFATKAELPGRQVNLTESKKDHYFSHLFFQGQVDGMIFMHISKDLLIDIAKTMLDSNEQPQQEDIIEVTKELCNILSNTLVNDLSKIFNTSSLNISFPIHLPISNQNPMVLSYSGTTLLFRDLEKDQELGLTLIF